MATTAHPESAVTHTHGLLATLARDLALVSDWLSCPPMTDAQPREHVVVETQPVRGIGPQPF